MRVWWVMVIDVAIALRLVGNAKDAPDEWVTPGVPGDLVLWVDHHHSGVQELMKNHPLARPGD